MSRVSDLMVKGKTTKIFFGGIIYSFGCDWAAACPAGKIIHRPTELDETSKTFFAMKLIAVYLMSLVFFVVISAAIDDPDDEEMITFKEFKKRNKKKYNGALERVHFKRWKKRRAVIRRHNNGTLSGGRKSSFKMGDNLFADQSEEEWETYLLGVNVPEEFISMNEEEEEVETTTTITDLEMENTTEEINEIDDRQTAPSLDLRNHPCMPPVKFQAPCGGCWAFIATTAVEYQTCLKSTNKTAVTLSEQQLIDCSGSYGTKGCNGGFYSQAWDYIMANGGQTTSATYPYTASTGTCSFTKGVTPVTGRISRYAYLAKNETSILTALTRGPIAVSIVANSKFILYSSGIFDDDTCKAGTINHGVVLVGYGRANATDYWIVRNSWGTSWGLNGYILMKRNVNICRIADFAFLATI